MIRAWLQRDRPFSQVPRWILVAALATLCAQLIWHGVRAPPQALVSELPEAPEPVFVRLASLEEPVAAAKVALLWLQAFDDPPGETLAFKDLDYERLEAWLRLIMELDPRAHAPLLAAAKVYTSTPDREQVMRMMALVHEQFLAAPNARWRWLAHVALLARYRLEDAQLALRFARDISSHAAADTVPFWARDLTVLLLEDLCELEAARVMVGGLLASKTLSDPGELAFLQRKLEALNAAEGCPPRVEGEFPSLSPSVFGPSS
ncbi:MAG: hypothetical protein GKR94_33175 [Gammaproteobacteria bacterium]|nr:hypothetical protein [Gammaproteobacteria bacterium]